MSAFFINTLTIQIISKVWLVAALFLFFPGMVRAAEIDVYLPADPQPGKLIPVQVYLNTEAEQTIGTDLLFSFDAQSLKFVEVETSDFYPHYHQVKVDQAKQQIRFSGTSNYQQYRQGANVLATLFFRKTGSKEINLDLLWEKGQTNDTNVIGIEGQDLLDQRPNIIAADLEDYPQPIDLDQVKPGKADQAPGQVLGEEAVEVGQRSVWSQAIAWLKINWWWLLIILLILVIYIWRRYKRQFQTKSSQSLR